MIRRAIAQDIQSIANLDRLGFSGNRPPGVAEKWITINFSRGDQYQYFVFEREGKVVGFIGWEIKNGFARQVPIIELEKFAVDPDCRGQGIGTRLIEETLPVMKEWIREQQPEAVLMRVIVWCLKGNDKIIEMYKKICPDGIQGERSIFSTDEVLLRGTYSL